MQHDTGITKDPISNRAHFVTLDGLRGLAAVCVMFFHCDGPFAGSKLFPHAFMAVDFFFILSGLVVAHAYEKKLATGSMSLGNFASRRAQRLYPLIILGAVIGGSYWLLRGTVGPTYELIYITLAILCLPWLGDEIQTGGIAPINSPGWSLFFELVANAVFAPIVRFLNTGLLLCIILVASCILIAATLQFDTISLGYTTITFPFGFARVIAPFFIGVGLNRLLNGFRLPDVPGWVLGLVLIISFLPTEFFRHAGVYELFCALFVYPTIVLFGTNSTNGPRLRKLAIISGELSYPLYILHMPIFRWLSWLLKATGANSIIHGRPAAIVVGPIAIGLTLIAARYYDEPVRKWMDSRLSTRTQ